MWLQCCSLLSWYLITSLTGWVLSYITSNRNKESALGAYADRSTIGWQSNHLLCIINASVNMIIYCFKDEQFRNATCQITRFDQVCAREAKTHKQEQEMPFTGSAFLASQDIQQIIAQVSHFSPKLTTLFLKTALANKP